MIVNLDRIKQALLTLVDAIDLHEANQSDRRLALALRDCIIQRFEYTYELAWKAQQRWIAENVTPESAEPVYSRKELFRVSARYGLIDDPLRWFDYHKARNISAHTYDEKDADQVYHAAIGLVDDVSFLIERLERHND